MANRSISLTKEFRKKGIVSTIIGLLLFGIIGLFLFYNVISNYTILHIKSKNDIYKVSSLVISQIRHELSINYPLDVKIVAKKKMGLCYDRSLILQKIFLYNKIPIRPIFVYFNSGSTKVSIFDLLAPNLKSHSVFEFKYKGEWYVMKTNSNLTKLIKLEQYISEGKTVPKYSKYVRGLSNRNSKFIYPSFLPDIYWFN